MIVDGVWRHMARHGVLRCVARKQCRLQCNLIDPRQGRSKGYCEQCMCVFADSGVEHGWLTGRGAATVRCTSSTCSAGGSLGGGCEAAYTVAAEQSVLGILCGTL
jgi:hypothetical protein